MRKSDFRNPLLQSGALLFIFLIFFSFVTSSGANGLGSGLQAIFLGIFHSTLFITGLIFSILLSITLLIVLFLAAVALYSVDKAKGLWIQLKSTSFDIISAMYHSILLKGNRVREIFRSQTSIIHQMEKELSDLKEHNQKMLAIIQHQEQQIEDLHSLNIYRRGDDSVCNNKLLPQGPSPTAISKN